MKDVVILLGCLAILPINSYTETKIKCADKLWAISHLVNNEQNLNYSLEAGANGLEMDLTFDDTGNPVNFYHANWLCDCECAPDSEVCKFAVCDNPRSARAVLRHFMSHSKMSQVAMLLVDSKVDDVPENLIEQAAANVVTMLEEEVLSKGYKGIVLIGGSNEDYLRSLATKATQSDFKNRLFIGHKWHKHFEEGLKILADLKYPNKIIASGMFRCLKWALGYGDEAVLGRVNKARGVISDTIIWTLDKDGEYDKYYNYGARGIISNNIKRLVNWAKRRRYQLYTADDAVCGATAGKENLVTDFGHCGCEKNGGGCRIDDEVASEQGSACRCSKQWFFGFVGCSGDVVGCKDVTSAQCKNPDRSELSCKQGAGDCGGY